MIMMNYTFGVLILLICLTSRAEEYRGIGFSPLINNDFPTARLFASFDAVLDALSKRGSVVFSETTVNNNLIQNQRLNISTELSHTILQKRECLLREKIVTCEVIVKVEKSCPLKKISVRLDVGECNGDEGLQLCYRIQKEESKESVSFHQVKLTTEVVIVWRVGTKEKILWGAPFLVSGIGGSLPGAIVSARQQINLRILNEKDKIQSEWVFFKNFREIRLRSSSINSKNKAYLTLLGGEVLCEGTICAVLLPKLVY
jgi:hypothetical protein